MSVPLPNSALSSTSFTEAWYSGVMKASTRLRPTTSSRWYPVISTALRFHSLTFPVMSMPKIGALA